jgi:ribosomal protein L12E/L44/L45/RPP1/RPP2
MASKPVAQLSAAEKEQLAVSYAAFVLSGQGAQVTADSINAVLTAAGLTANAGLVKAFAKTLSTRNVKDFLGSVGGSGPAETKAEAKEDKKKDAPKDNKDAGKDAKGGKNVPPPPPPPPQEEEDMNMGGLFD